MFLADLLYHRVQVFSPTGAFLGSWGRWGSRYGDFNQPRGIGVGADGTLHVADTANNRVQIFNVRFPGE